MSQDDVINELLASGLRGRGGAGFPTGKKYSVTGNNAKVVIALSLENIARKNETNINGRKYHFCLST